MGDEFLQAAFAPVVLVITSKDAEVACGANHLSFTEMLAPFLTFNGAQLSPPPLSPFGTTIQIRRSFTRLCVLALPHTDTSCVPSCAVVCHTVAKPQYPEPFALRMVTLKDLIR